MHSPIISDVDYLLEEGHVLVTAGALAFELTYVSADERSFQWIEQPEKTRIIEVDFDGNVMFEMLVKSPIVNGSVYRSEKINFFRGE